MAVSDLFKKLLAHVRPTSGEISAARYAYGKVPGAGDFLRAGVRSVGTTAFEEWLATALATADSLRGKAFREAYDREPCWLVQARFGGEEDGRILAGAMRASRDAVGRRHPLVIGALLPGDLQRTHPEHVALAIADTQREAHALLQRSTACASNKDLVALLEGLPLPSAAVEHLGKERWEQLLEREAKSFFDARFADGARRTWALRTLREAVTPLEASAGKRPTGARISTLLAFPAGGTCEESVAVLSRLARAWGTEPTDPVMVLSPARAANGAGNVAAPRVFFACGQEPPTSTLVDVLGAGAPTDTLCDLHAEGLTTTGYRTDLPAAFETASRDPQASLRVVLAALES